MQPHQACERRAVLIVIALAQGLRLVERKPEMLRDELPHARVDLGEQVAV